MPGYRLATGNLWVGLGMVSVRHGAVRPIQYQIRCQFWVRGLLQRSQITVKSLPIGMGPQTPMICPSDIVSSSSSSDLPATIFPKMRALCQLRSIVCMECSTLERGRAGLAARQWPPRAVCGLGSPGSQGHRRPSGLYSLSFCCKF